MSNKKLTKDLRNEISQRVLKATFKERFEAHEAEERPIAQALYDTLVPAEHYKLMLALPKDYFEWRDDACFYFLRPLDNRYEALVHPLYSENQFVINRRRSSRLYLPASRPLPACAERGSGFVVPSDAPALAQYRDWYERYKATIAEARALEERINGVLSSVTTVKRLLDAWPEVRPHIPDEALFDTDKSLPTVVIADLNALIDKAKSTYVAKPVGLDPAAVVNDMVAAEAA